MPPHSGTWKRVGPGRWKSPTDGQVYNSDVDPSKFGGVPQWRGKANQQYDSVFAGAAPAAPGAAPTGAGKPLIGPEGKPPPGVSQEQWNAEQAKKNEDINRLLGPGAAGAGALSEQMFPEGSLGRLQFQGVEGRGLVDRYRSIADQYSTGAPSANEQDALSRFKSLAATAGNRSTDIQDTLSRYKSGLDGYASAELTGMREQAMEGIESDAQSQARRLQKAQGSNVQGAAKTAQFQRLNQAKLGARAGLERDLFVKNADERQRRLGEYSGFLSNVEQAEYDRSLGANTAYGQYSTGIADRGIARQLDSMGAYANQYATTRADDVQTQMYNNQQMGNEQAGRYGTFFGGLNLGLANQAQAEDFALNQQYLDIARKRYGSTGGRGNSNNTPAQTTNPYYQEAINLLQQR